VSGSVEERLAKEAAFQNKRMEAAHEGEIEARDRFYYLAARAMERYHERIASGPGDRVVVVGCSEGGVQQHAKGGAVVTGIDIADEAVSRLNEELAAAGWSNADARVMNAEALEVPPRSVDLICCSGVLHHLDVPRAIASWAAALKPNGRVVMIEPMAYNPLIAAYRKLTPSMRTDDEHPLIPRDFAAMERHFRTVAVEPFVLTSMLSLPLSLVWPRARDRVLPALERLDDALTARLAALRYLCWTAVIELADPR